MTLAELKLKAPEMVAFYARVRDELNIKDAKIITRKVNKKYLGRTIGDARVSAEVVE